MHLESFKITLVEVHPVFRQLLGREYKTQPRVIFPRLNSHIWPQFITTASAVTIFYSLESEFQDIYI